MTRSRRHTTVGDHHVERYESEIDLGNPNLSHTQVIDLVGHDKSVLDVGCATGDVARALVARGCRVSGLDVDAAAAETARPDLDQLVIADLDTSSLAEHFKPGSFDVIIFVDVLEHLLEPERVLEESLALLAPQGRVVVCIPNVAHGGVRLALLQGRWQYTETGLLDATHVRFFTRSTFLELLHGAGLVVEDLRSTVADPLAVEVAVDGDRIPAAVIEWVRDQPDALSYQFIASARQTLEGEPEDAGSEQVLTPALPTEEVRLEDRYTRGHRDQIREEQDRVREAHAHVLEEQALRHRLLMVRDHIIGLEAGVASAVERQMRAELRATRAEQRVTQARKNADLAKKNATKADERAAKAEVKATQAQARAKQTGRRADQADRELREVKASRTWRAGRALTMPLRIGRGRKEA